MAHAGRWSERSAVAVLTVCVGTLFAHLAPAPTAAQSWAVELGAGMSASDGPEALQGAAPELSAAVSYAWNDAWSTRLAGGYARPVGTVAEHTPWLLTELEYSIDSLRVMPLLGAGASIRPLLPDAGLAPLVGLHLLLGLRVELSSSMRGDLLVRPATWLNDSGGGVQCILQFAYRFGKV